MNDVRLDQYRRFVERAVGDAESDGYLFDEPRCRFVPEASDELVLAPGARLSAAPGGVLVELGPGARLLLRGFELSELQRAFSLLPCRYSRLVLELGPRLSSLIDQAFSKILFAPAAVAELEAEVSAVELVRFPGSPYEVVRSYWRNACSVRRRMAAEPLPDSTAELRSLLLELHELMLLGESTGGARDSFYLPASALGRKRPAPGTFYDVPASFEERAGETILTSGARVSVPLLGGEHYWQLLGESLDDPDVLSDRRSVTFRAVELGGVVHGRAPDEARSRPWFVPPRPLTEAHFELLLAALTSASAAERASDLPAALQALASFHYFFVRAHPLPSANQSLSMCFVNAALQRLLGFGMPHLLLDQMALRFELSAYRRLFSRMVRMWCAPWPNAAGGLGPADGKAQRLRHLLRMRSELNAFVAALQSAPSLLAARALLVDERASLAGLAEPSR